MLTATIKIILILILLSSAAGLSAPAVFKDDNAYVETGTSSILM